MKLLQLNTWSLHLAPAIVQLLDREDPDILCLQEVVSTESGRKMLGSIQEVLAAHEFEYYYFSPLVRFTYMHHAAERGNMILSKYPITFAHEFWTAGELQTDFTKDISYDAARNVVHAQVETPAGLLHVLTTHGYHIREHKQGDEHTLAACKRMGEYIDTLEGPVVLTGDFNLVPESESMQVLNAKLHNLTLEHKVKTTRNHLTTKTEPCDYILTRDLKARSFAVLDDIVSDHLALMLEFDDLSATID